MPAACRLAGQTLRIVHFADCEFLPKIHRDCALRLKKTKNVKFKTEHRDEASLQPDYHQEHRSQK